MLPPTDKKKEKSAKDDLKDASDDMKKDSKNGKQKAKPKQKSAAKKMKQMGGQMMDMMMGGDMEQMEEDVKMLRQILDNLLAYSFAQEDVMGKFKGSTTHSPSFSKNLKIQQDLKQQFRHVDDSIFAMSLRNPKITEKITEEVGNVHYYVDKAIADLADNVVPRGVSNQQYAVTSANKLADFLSDALNNMQMEMQGSGTGSPKPGKGGKGDMQLPDIMQKQEKLAQKMKDGKEGDNGKKGEGKEGEPKDGGKSKGQGGQGTDSEDGDQEGDAEKLLEIYKEQQQLREALQKALDKQGMGGNGQNAMREMKEIEKQLLNKGFKGDAMQRMQRLKHELLKLDKAIQQQGEENKRQSQTNTKEFNNNGNKIPDALKEYLNSVEILNRQSLPLRPNFNQRVQTYFRKDD